MRAKTVVIMLFTIYGLYYPVTEVWPSSVWVAFIYNRLQNRFMGG